MLARKEVIMGIRPECLHDEVYIERFPDSIVGTDVDVVEMMGSRHTFI